jgi:hypothetical protein
MHLRQSQTEGRRGRYRAFIVALSTGRWLVGVNWSVARSCFECYIHRHWMGRYCAAARPGIGFVLRDKQLVLPAECISLSSDMNAKLTASLVLLVGLLPLAACYSIRLGATLVFAMLFPGAGILRLARRRNCGTSMLAFGLVCLGAAATGMLSTWMSLLRYNGSMTRELLVALFVFQLFAVPLGLLALLNSLGKRQRSRPELSFSTLRLLQFFVPLSLAAGAARWLSDSWAGISMAVACALFATVLLLVATVLLLHRRLEFLDPERRQEQKRWLAIAAFAILYAVGTIGAWSQARHHGEIFLTLHKLPDLSTINILKTNGGTAYISGARQSQRIRLPAGDYILVVTAPLDVRLDGVIGRQSFSVSGQRIVELNYVASSPRRK